jgi:hypothetical protein
LEEVEVTARNRCLGRESEGAGKGRRTSTFSPTCGWPLNFTLVEGECGVVGGELNGLHI